MRSKDKLIRKLIRLRLIHIFSMDRAGFDSGVKLFQINEKQMRVNGITLPMPENDIEVRTFRWEFYDILFPYMVCDKSRFDKYITCGEGPYELGEVKLEEGDIVFDCGANIGAFSALASTRIGESGKVYAFEPVTILREKFTCNTASWNGNNGNIIVKPYALYDKNQKLHFDISGINIGSGSITHNKNDAEDQPHIIEVEAVTIDDFAERNMLRVDFIKADIEGAERDMLRGAKNVLKKYAPKISVCKYHLPDDPEVLRDIILDANPDYIIQEKWGKIFAYVPK